MEGKTGRPINIQVIGIIQTRFKEASGTPIQTVYGQGADGRVLINEPFVRALDDIEGFERLWLIYWMDRVGPFRPKVVPYRDNTEHGLFATRSPTRPNPIGLSVVRLIKREGSVLHVADMDILDGTQLLDIKPYIPDLNPAKDVRIGWLTDKVEGMNKSKSGDR